MCGQSLPDTLIRLMLIIRIFSVPLPASPGSPARTDRQTTQSRPRISFIIRNILFRSFIQTWQLIVVIVVS